MKKRSNFRRPDIAERYQLIGGRCELCHSKLKPGNYHADHINPDGLTGSNDPSNMQLLCIPCHKIKTQADVANIARAKRRQWKHSGVPKRKSLLGRGNNQHRATGQVQKWAAWNDHDQSS